MLEHFDKNNLHHAYLIEGDKEKVLPDILEFVKSLGIQKGSADFYQAEFDSFKVDDARNLKAHGTEKGFSTSKKIFLISANNFLLEAQNSLLKLFEEPIENTHFFVVVPDIQGLLPTFISRFYVVYGNKNFTQSKEIEKFLKMNMPTRLDFIKELLAERDEEIENSSDSPRAKALQFLNALEATLSKNILNTPTSSFDHVFKVREFLRMPGSSTKTLMESVALVVPVY